MIIIIIYYSEFTEQDLLLPEYVGFIYRFAGLFTRNIFAEFCVVCVLDKVTGRDFSI